MAAALLNSSLLIASSHTHYPVQMYLKVCSIVLKKVLRKRIPGKAICQELI
jgi:hypothetical protein